MPGKEDKLNAVLTTEESILLPINGNTMEYFSDKGEWMNAQQCI